MVQERDKSGFSSLYSGIKYLAFFIVYQAKMLKKI